MYGELGRYQESEEMFKKAMKINPTYAEAYFNLGKHQSLNYNNYDVDPMLANADKNRLFSHFAIFF